MPALQIDIPESARMILLQEKKSEALRTRDSGSVSSLAFRFVLCFLSKNYFAVSFLHVDSLDVMSFGAILVHGISRGARVSLISLNCEAMICA